MSNLLEITEIVHELTVDGDPQQTTHVIEEVVNILEVAAQGPQGIQGPPGSVGPGGGLTEIVQDTSPQLGGDLDLNGNTLVNGQIENPTLVLDGGLL